jgi:hypothetical protein
MAPPTIGRIVHYFETDPATKQLVTMPALVNGVYGETLFADLDVRGKTVKLQRTRVPYNEKPADGYWTWPPR